MHDESCGPARRSDPLATLMNWTDVIKTKLEGQYTTQLLSSRNRLTQIPYYIHIEYQHGQRGWGLHRKAHMILTSFFFSLEDMLVSSHLSIYLDRSGDTIRKPLGMEDEASVPESL